MSELQKAEAEGVDGAKGKGRVTSENLSAPPEFCDGLPLPAEIFTIIAEFLIGENNFESLANLNATTHLIREATNAVLWTTVLLDTITPRWNAILETARSESGVISNKEARQKIAELAERTTRWKAESGSLPTNCKYVKYVFWTIRSRIPRKFLPSIFPNLALCISHGDHDDIDTRSYPVYRLLHGTKVVGASVYRPVSFFFLLCHILQAPIRQLAKSPDQSAPSVSLPCYLATLQIYNSAYVYEDARMNSSDFDVDRIILRPLRTLVQFHAPKPQRSRDRVAQDFGPERAQRNARTFLSLLKLAGRSSSLTETTSSVHSPPPAWNSSEYLEAYTQGGGFRLTDPPYIATTLDKDEFAQMMIRYPESVQACPDILRCRLFVARRDAVSPEMLTNAIKQFQACYANFPDLIPYQRSVYINKVQVVQIWHLNASLGMVADGALSGTFRDGPAAREVVALVAEVYIGNDLWHTSSVPVSPAAQR